ncbi:unnamed protein product [Peniophora sp. CBMAI 1063]|nr:unnamed protein product [Peniophora sp. CBMAI 1063]
MSKGVPMAVDDLDTTHAVQPERAVADASTATVLTPASVQYCREASPLVLIPVKAHQTRDENNLDEDANQGGSMQEGRDDESMASAHGEVEIVDDSALVEKEAATELAEGEDALEMLDIKESIKSAFAACESGFQGTYATWQKYPSAPNPCMDIDGLGLLGLPLSTTEAGRLRVRCNPAAFGKGERTVIDTSVRDTSELDGAHIRFLNPLWDTWVEEAVLKACEQLGVTGKRVRHELYKLLLYETGSHFHMHQDTEKSPGMFATVVIVLPSPHEGGSVHVKHGRQEKMLDASGEDIATTSVLAWYTDVFHEVKPVTKGFRLALAFNLMHTGVDVPIPRAPAFDTVFQELEEALSAWHARDVLGYTCPKRLIYVLSHHYSQANVSFVHLKGVDSTLVNLLREVAEQRGFCVVLGHLTYCVGGMADDDYGGRWGNNDVSMGEINDTVLSLQLISGTTGINIGRSQEIEARYDGDSDYDEEEADEAELLIDKEYWDSQRPDKKDYEGYQGNGAGSLELFYHRTVVAIWPASQNISVVTSVGGRDIAIVELKKCASSHPTTTDLSNVSLALTSGTPDVACLVADLSIRWNDPALWHDALKSCRGESDIETLGMQRVHTALKLFKFSDMQSALEAIVSKTMSTRRRLRFIDEISACFDDDDAEAALVPSAWAGEKRRYILSSLRTPELDDISPMVELVISFPDAASFFCDTVLPQLQALNLSYAWWMTFADSLRTSEGAAASLSTWESSVFAISKKIFERTLLHLPSNKARFALLDELSRSWSSLNEAIVWVNETREWAIQNITCPTADDVDLIVSLVRTRRDFFSTILCPTLQRVDYVDQFSPGLINQLQQVHREDGSLLPEDWATVVADALRSPLSRAQVQATSNDQVFTMLDHLANVGQDLEALKLVIREQKCYAMRNLKKPAAEELPLLINELKDDIACRTLLAPQFRNHKLDLNIWEGIVKMLRDRSDEYIKAGWSREQLHALCGDLVLEAVSSTKFPPELPQHPQPARSAYLQEPSGDPRYSQQAVTMSSHTIKMLLWICLRAKHREMAVHVFRKVFTTCTTADSVRSIVKALVPTVLSVLQSWKVAMDAPPFDQFFRESIRSFIISIVGKKPDAHDNAQWARTLRSSCTCGDCTSINHQIASSQKQTVWRASQSRRDHVERQLRGIRELKLSTAYGGRGRMSELIITKRLDEYAPLALWSKRSAEGMQLLRQLGQDATIRSVYASVPGQLETVVACLQGNAAPSALSAAAFMTPPSQPASNAATGAGPQPASSAVSSLEVAAGSTVPRKRKAPPPNPEDVIEISD